METKQIPITLYAESTPNPATMKFVANKLLVENGTVLEYTTAEDAKESPLAGKLFEFPFVTGVFITSNFITVTKNETIAWEEVVQELRQYILVHLKSGGKVVKETPPASESAAASAGIEKKIIDIMDEYIRPAVQQDGGAIHFKSYREGVVTVILKGACSGCPSASVTLKAGIEALLQRMIPEVKEVVAEEY